MVETDRCDLSKPRTPDKVLKSLTEAGEPEKNMTAFRAVKKKAELVEKALPEARWLPTQLRAPQ